MISINSTQVVGLEQQGSDVQWAICSIECDTSSELPTYDQFKQTHNILLYQKSFAHVIDKNEIYEMNGQGSWIRQKSNSNIMLDAENVIYDNTNSGLSAENVQDAIDEIKSNDDMQDRALAELYAENANQQLEIDYAINTGCKNLFNINETPVVTRTTYTLTDEKLNVIANGVWAHYSVPIDLPAGNYILSLIISDYSKESGAPDTSMRMRLAVTTSGTSYLLQTITGNGTMTIPFTWDGGQVYIQFYPNYNATSYANSFSASDVMIRQSVITSSTYEPYAPSNRELYEIEQQQETEIQGKTSISQLFGVKTSLQSGTDLDSLNAGVVGCGGASIASTLLHCPTSTSAFILFTDYVVAESRSIQRLYGFNTISGVPNIFIRSKYSGGWSEWYEVSLQQVATVQSSSASLMQTGMIDAEMTDNVKDNDDEER